MARTEIGMRPGVLHTARPAVWGARCRHLENEHAVVRAIGACETIVPFFLLPYPALPIEGYLFLSPSSPIGGGFIAGCDRDEAGIARIGLGGPEVLADSRFVTASPATLLPSQPIVGNG